MYRKYGFFARLLSFSGKMERVEFWSELGIRAIGYLCSSILLCIVISVLVPGNVEYVSHISEIGALILAVLWLIPIAALTRRRLRDAGYGAKSYLWLLLPVVGWIVFVFKLCKEGK